MDATPTDTHAAAAGTVRIGERDVNRLGYGAMRLTGEGVWGPPPDREAARRLLRIAVGELGVELIDTADSYGPDVNEEIVAEALHPYPDRVLIATKGGLERPGSGEWPRNGRPEHLREALEGSLRRLRVETIDLYQLHAPDPDVPFEESVGAFAELKEEGKVAAVGLSNVSLEQVRTAREIVEITSVQNRYNPWDRRSEESGILEYCHEEGITFIPYSPLGGGRRVKLLPESDGLRRVAERVGHTVQEVVLAWILSKSPSLVPIPGASRTESIESSVRAADLELDGETVAEVEEALGDLPD